MSELTPCGPLCDRQHQVDEPHNRNLAPVAPQDHKPKAAPAPHTFTVTERDEDGNEVEKTYELPKVDEQAAAEIPGDISYDAIMNPESDMAQMRLAFATLEACKPGDELLKALRSLNTKRMLEIVGRWMGESSGSSA